MSRGAQRRAVLAGGLGLALTGCGETRLVGFDKARGSLDICNYGEPRSLDPHKITSACENNIVGNLFVGLITDNARAEPIAGLAERWETSADGLTWSFSLRRARWSDGEACDAHDFAFALRRALDPATSAPCAFLLYPLRNAEAVNLGRLPGEALGVRAIDDGTLEVQLEYPAPYLPRVLKHPVAFPVPKHRLARHGEDWLKPANIAVNGAFAPRRWLSNYIVHMERNRNFYDAGNVALEHLYFYPTRDLKLMAERVAAGEAGWATRFTANDTALARELAGFARVAPHLACEYFCFNTRRAPFDDARVRQALAMAYAPPAGEAPATALIPPGAVNYPRQARTRWAEGTAREHRREAERLLRAAGFGPERQLRLEIAHLSASDAPRLAAARRSWGAIAPWVEVSLSAAANANALAARLRAGAFEIGEAGSAGLVNDAASFLAPHGARGGERNISGYANPVFDRLLWESDVEADPAKRGRLLSQAEQILLDDAPLCVSGYNNSANLVHPDLGGYEDNPEDLHRARWFKVRG
jgi:oligopeptide transport system substrate-binding protein